MPLYTRSGIVGTYISILLFKKSRVLTRWFVPVYLFLVYNVAHIGIALAQSFEPPPGSMPMCGDKPHTLYAAQLLLKIKDAILYPLIALLLGLAIMMFLWGVFKMVSSAESDEARSTGRRHMLWGIIGMVVMLSALAILRIAAATFGVAVPNC